MLYDQKARCFVKKFARRINISADIRSAACCAREKHVCISFLIEKPQKMRPKRCITMLIPFRSVMLDIRDRKSLIAGVRRSALWNGSFPRHLRSRGIPREYRSEPLNAIRQLKVKSFFFSIDGIYIILSMAWGSLVN